MRRATARSTAGNVINSASVAVLLMSAGRLRTGFSHWSEELQIDVLVGRYGLLDTGLVNPGSRVGNPAFYLLIPTLAGMTVTAGARNLRAEKLLIESRLTVLIAQAVVVYQAIKYGGDYAFAGHHLLRVLQLVREKIF